MEIDKKNNNPKNTNEWKCCSKTFQSIYGILVFYCIYIIASIGIVFLPIAFSYLFVKRNIGKGTDCLNKILLYLLFFITIPLAYISSILYIIYFFFKAFIIQSIRNLFRKKVIKTNQNQVNPSISNKEKDANSFEASRKLLDINADQNTAQRDIPPIVTIIS